MKLKCKDCGRSFIFDAGEQKYYTLRGWNPPKRCKSCQQLRKTKSYDPYAGWQSLMMPGNCKKQRHTRVHYAPYTVGGFR